MFGLDDRIATLSHGGTLAVVVAIAVVLGLRHAGDPDHLAAVSTLVAAGRERARRAGLLGLSWGLGHATSLVAFGLPIVLYRAYLPEQAQRALETAVGIVIAGLAVVLFRRWRRGSFRVHVHAHEHGGVSHTHLHSHARERGHAHVPTRPVRSPAGAFGIGLLHGAGGSAGVCVLLLAAIPGRGLALAALVLFAGACAVSMAAISTGFGLAVDSRLARNGLHRVAPALAVVAVAYGAWYALAAQQLLPGLF
jgi:ABC-type nickel/cobalt efflux system permease component RcnA